MGSIDAYEEIRLIGRGAYGTAHVVREKSTKQMYVMKKIHFESIDKKEIDDARAEVWYFSHIYVERNTGSSLTLEIRFYGTYAPLV